MRFPLCQPLAQRLGQAIPVRGRRAQRFQSSRAERETPVTTTETTDDRFDVGAASFGPFDFDVTAPLALMVDDTMPTRDGCQAATVDLTGTIALVDRGDCTFAEKILNAQDAGAVLGITVPRISGVGGISGSGNRFRVPVGFGILRLGTRAELGRGRSGHRWFLADKSL